MERPFDVPEHLYPFTSRWVDAGGLPIHYIDEGTGPALLFLHGNPTWSFLYRDIVKALRADHRCVALDYPGMGMSAKPRDVGRPAYAFTPEEHTDAVEAAIEALDLRDVTLMGQDWGGPIGLGAAVRHPERYARLVIGNTWAWPRGDLPVHIFSNALGRGPGRWLVRHRNLFVERLLPAGVANKDRLTDAVMDAYRAPYPTTDDREPLAVFPRAILGSRAFLAELYSALGVLAHLPVQLVWGNRDPAFKKRELDRWQHIFPHARVHILDGASHFIQEDAPEAIAGVIRRFVADTPARAHRASG